MALAKRLEYTIHDMVHVYDFQNDNMEQYDLPGEIPVALYQGNLRLQ